MVRSAHPSPVTLVPPARGGQAWTDAELVRAVLQGDARAAEALYDLLRPGIDHALRRVLHGRYRDVEDLMQTTFERVLRALAEDRFDGRSSLRTWASAIAGHVALDALRSSYRNEKRLSPIADDELPHSVRPEGRLAALAELRRVQAILSGMKPDLAETLVLHDVLGHQLEEIAHLRAASLAATQSRLHRARLELTRRINQTISRRSP
jgi:RNA polymerase sigma factor (sigma-70 family)